jgi:TetR/AcrR family transcriptional repressor of nem operon
MDAKQRILKAGARLVHEKGFNDTGLQEILDAAQVPKGSFYYYFKNKEDFGLQLIDFFAQDLLARADDHYGDESLPCIERIRALFKWQAEAFRRRDYKGGCPIGNLSLEMANLNSNFRDKLNQFFVDMKAGLAVYLDQARQRGEIPEAIDIEETADFIISSWEGALMQMKVSKSSQPHEVFDRMIFVRLLGR